MTVFFWLWLILCAHAELVDRIVAVVGDEIVLASEIALEDAISRADTPAVPFWAPTHKTPFERLTEAALIRHTAGDVAIYSPSSDDIQARIDVIRRHFKDRGSWTLFLDRWMLDESSLRIMVKRRIVVERYLARNISESPTNTTQWLQACDQTILGLQGNVRVRIVAESGNTP